MELWASLQIDFLLQFVLDAIHVRLLLSAVIRVSQLRTTL